MMKFLGILLAVLIIWFIMEYKIEILWESESELPDVQMQSLAKLR